MTRFNRRVLLTAVLTGACVAAGPRAHAALTSAEQKCIDRYNHKLRLVGQQAGKDYRTCIRKAGRGLEADPEACVTNDVPGKIALKAAKVAGLYTDAICTGIEPIQQGAATGNAALVDSSEDLVQAIFGIPILPATVVSPGVSEAKCQHRAYQRAELLFTEKMKAFRSCKKDGMRAGTVTNPTDLATLCMSDPQPFAIPDPLGKQARKAQKLLDDVDANCAAPVVIATQFPGECSGSATTAALGACIERVVECKVCSALNAADGMVTDCDLFDDGLANSSCCGAGGHLVGGACWYLGVLGESCDDTCTARGETYSTATQSFAGDTGSDANCEAVLNALGIPGSLTYPSGNSCVGAFGCARDVPDDYTVRCINQPTTSSAAYPGFLRRACACQ